MLKFAGDGLSKRSMIILTTNVRERKGTVPRPENSLRSFDKIKKNDKIKRHVSLEGLYSGKRSIMPKTYWLESDNMMQHFETER